jgi:FtsP/CotA-like multicopper oxidase with cupredoxin domain
MTMRMFSNKRIRAWLMMIAAAGGLTLIDSSAAAAPVTLDLCALDGTAAIAPSVPSLPIWGFGQPTTPGDCTTATAGLPGPLLAVDEGDTVTLSVTNALPPGHTISIEVPGISFDAGPTDADAGATVTRTFTASDPGTYIYQSSGDAGRQLAMGLYGALIVRPSVVPADATPTDPTDPASYAYDKASTAFDVEAPLVLSQVDPAFNAAPNTFNMLNYKATYWLINGKAYPDTEPIDATSGQKVLLRYVNAGYDNSAMSLLGVHEHVIARDAHLLGNPFDAATETIPAGATEDTIVTVPDTAPTTSCGFALFNRNLHVTNGSSADSTYATPGGMLTFIAPTGSCPPSP